MLHSLVFISSSGLVLFCKEFISGSVKAESLGGVLTAMLKVSSARTGLPVSFIEFDRLSVALALSTGSNSILCAVIYDSIDGAEFGKLVASQLVGQFVSSFQRELSSGDAGVRNLDSFADFNTKIASGIRGAVQPIIDQLEEQRGIEMALFVPSDGVSMNSSLGGLGGLGMYGVGGLSSSSNNGLINSSNFNTIEFDKLSILANHSALISVANDILGGINDSTLQSVTMNNIRNTLLVQRIERSSLIVIFKNSVDVKVCQNAIDSAASLIKKVLVLASNLKT